MQCKNILLRRKQQKVYLGKRIPPPSAAKECFEWTSFDLILQSKMR